MARRTRRRQVPIVNPFTDRTDRSACYAVSPYQALVWREAYEGLSYDERKALTAVKVPGFVTTFGAEVTHRLCADPVVEIGERDRYAALRAHLHTIVEIPSEVRARTFQRPSYAATCAAAILKSLAVYLCRLAEQPDPERTEQEQAAMRELGLDMVGADPNAPPGPGGAASGIAGDTAAAATGLTPQQVAEAEAATAAATADIDTMAANMKQAAKDAAQQVAPKREIGDAWNDSEDVPANGGIGKGSDNGGGGAPPDLSLAGVAAHHPELRRVVALAGRLVPVLDRLADDKRAREGMGRSRIEATREIPRLTTFERAGLAGLRGGIIAADTYRRVSEGSALGYQGEDPRGEGPIVLCIDQSGSMFERDVDPVTSQFLDSTKQEWAQAVALAIIVRATRSHRRVAIVPYDSHVQPETVRAWSKRPTVDGACDALRMPGHGGGTNWTAGMTACLDLIQYVQSARMKRADIIHITDGQPNSGVERDRDAIRARAAAMNGRIHGIAVGRNALQIAGSPTSVLARWSDTICAVTDTTCDSVAVQALGRI